MESKPKSTIENDPTKWKFSPEEILKHVRDPFVTPSVTCDKCGVLHDIGSEDFFTVYGNICRGLGGGMIGNNLHEGEVMRINIFCLDCFCDYLCKEEE